jgi:hypothetical protein
VTTDAHSLDRRGDRFVRIVADYTAVLGSGLTVLIVFRAAGIGVFLVFVLPLFLAAWMTVQFRGRPILVVAAILLGVPGVLSLIGGVGLLILPASLLLLVAAFR